MDASMMDDQTAESGTETESPQAYCIEIHVSADGKISVGVEPEAEEAAEEQGAGESSEGAEQDNAQPVTNIKEALQIAMDIYKNDGQVMDASAGEDEFAAGFATGPKVPQGPARKFA